MYEPPPGREPILFLSPEPPYPLAGGGPLRSASLLHYLSRRARVHLVTFAEEGSPNPEPFLPRGLVERITTIYLPYHARDPFSRIRRNTRRLLQGQLPLMDRFSHETSLERVALSMCSGSYSLAVIEHFWCARYLPILEARARAVVLDLHNVESVLHAACARSEPWPYNLGHHLFHQRARQMERRMLGSFHLVLAASDGDAERVRALAPEAHVEVYPNAVPWRPAPASQERELIAFSGNFEYHPNISAVKFFAAKVWPELRQRRPNLVWRLIGRNEHAIRHIVGGDSRVELSGAVDDAIAELAQAQVVVAPLLAGSGTRIKILEAWAAGRAVVSSAIGAEGLPAEDGRHLLLAATPQEWTERVERLLDAPQERRRLGDAGRALYEQEYCWPAAWRKLDEALERWAPAKVMARAR